MLNLAKDLSLISSSDKKIFDKISRNIEFCICNYLEDAALNNEDQLEIDLGFGILKIIILEDTVKYLFTPSNTLESGIINTLENGQNNLTTALDSTLVNRLNRLYERLL